MLAYNPFSDLGASIPPFAMQAFFNCNGTFGNWGSGTRHDAQKEC